MTIGVLWEFCEFTVDSVLKIDTQRDRIVENVYSVDLNKENTLVKVKDIEKTEIYSKDGNKTTIKGYLDVGLYDTIKDLFVNLIGAAFFSVIGYLYIKNRDKYKFVERLIPRKN